ncbi:MAG: cell wall-active antibiotics response protein [Treponema sp.]|nr:cell wall-active antibiotics response protein [Treponema sp.]
MKVFQANTGLRFGLVMLVVAGLILASQFVAIFENFGVLHIVLAGIAGLMLINCIVRLNFSTVLIPLAVLYYCFWEALGLPRISTWALILVAAFGTAGLGSLFPHRHAVKAKRQWKEGPIFPAGTEGNSSLSASFGNAHHRLPPGPLESVGIQCSFADMKVDFEDAEPKDGSATVSVTCSFGRVRLLVPGHWRIENEIDCSLGGVEIHDKAAEIGEGSPKLILCGNVSFGNVEIRYK